MTYVKQKARADPRTRFVSYVKGSALAVVISFLPATLRVLPFRGFAEASEEAPYHHRSFPL